MKKKKIHVAGHRSDSASRMRDTCLSRVCHSGYQHDVTKAKAETSQVFKYSPRLRLLTLV